MVRVIRHSNKGSTWDEHKYIAIENGRYIYPEDLGKGSTSSLNTENSTTSGSNSGTTTSNSSSSSSNSSKTSTKTTKSDKKKIKKHDKGSVKSYKDLPEDPEIGDMYTLEDTHAKVYWTGEIWTTVEKSESSGLETAQQAPAGGGGGGGSKKEAKEEAAEASKPRVTYTPNVPIRRKEVKTVKLNPGGSSGVSSKSSVSSARSTSAYTKGRTTVRSIASSAKKLATSTASAIKNSKVVSAGRKFVTRLFNKPTVKLSSGKGGGR